MKDTIFLFTIILAILVVPLGFFYEWTLTKIFLVGYFPLLFFLFSFGHVNKRHIYNMVLLAICLIMYRIFINVGSFYTDLFYWIILPIVLTCSSYVKDKDFHPGFLYVGVLIYITNCLVCCFEYMNQINLFYHDLSYFERYRASGLWGHPLYGAVIHGMCMLYIVMSDLSKMPKIVLYVLGLFTIFTYDARMATLGVIVSTILLLYHHNIISSKNILYIVCSIVGSYFLFDFLESSDLGGKLFKKDGLMVEYNDPRIVAFKIFFELSFQDIFCGISTVSQEMLAFQNNVKCIENGIFTHILNFGIVLGLVLLYFISINTIRYMHRYEKFDKMLCFSFFFVVAATSQALSTAYVWLYILFFYLLFRPNKKAYL